MLVGGTGEHDSFVVDGPLFKNRIDFKSEGIVKDTSYAYLNIK